MARGGDKLREFGHRSLCLEDLAGGRGSGDEVGSRQGPVMCSLVDPKRELGFYSKLVGKPRDILTRD